MNALSYIEIDPSQTHAKAAATTVTSIASAVAGHYAGVNDLIQTAAGLVALGSGCMAIAYYYVSILEKLRKLKEQKDNKDQ